MIILDNDVISMGTHFNGMIKSFFFCDETSKEKVSLTRFCSLMEILVIKKK